MRTVTLLGSTGAIGTQALEVIAAHPDRFTVTALAADGSDLERAARQAVEFEAEALAVAGVTRAEVTAALERARHDLGRTSSPEVLVGSEAAAGIAGAGVDVVLNGMTGLPGLAPTLAALAAGSNLALANRESLIAGGALVRSALLRPDQLVPVDAAQSAVAQALRAGGAGELARLVLMAPGGPFHGHTAADLGKVSPRELPAAAGAGPAGATNSASLIATGLALIEAHVLFDVPVERIDAMIHRQSLVHSLVEFIDGSTIAHACPPDERRPIGLALSWPERLPMPAAPRDWQEGATWTFEPVDHETFPAIELCRAAVTATASHPAVLDAANEECVAAFLDGRLPFPRITEIIAHVLDDHDGVDAGSLDLEGLTEVDGWARARSLELIERDRHR